MKTTLLRISTVPPGSPITRLMKSAGVLGVLEHDHVAALDGLLGKELVLQRAEEPEYTTLFTSRWSLIRRFVSMEPVN